MIDKQNDNQEKDENDIAMAENNDLNKTESIKDDQNNAENFENLTEIEQIDRQNQLESQKDLEIQTNNQEVVEVVDTQTEQQTEIQKIDWNESVVREQQKLMNIKNVANILCDLGFIALAFSIAAVVGGIILVLLKFVFVLVVGAVLVVLFIGTVGMLLLTDGYKAAWKWLGKIVDNQNLLNFVNILLGIVPFTSAIGIASLIVSIIFNCLSKNQKNVPRLVLSSICLGLLVVSVIIIALGVRVNS